MSTIMIKDNVERIAATPEQAARLKADGFKPLDVDAVKPETAEAPAELDKMNTAQLRALSKEKGVEAADALNKKELLSVLKDVV